MMDQCLPRGGGLYLHYSTWRAASSPATPASPRRRRSRTPARCAPGSPRSREVSDAAQLYQQAGLPVHAPSRRARKQYPRPPPRGRHWSIIRSGRRHRGSGGNPAGGHTSGAHTSGGRAYEAALGPLQLRASPPSGSTRIRRGAPRADREPAQARARSPTTSSRSASSSVRSTASNPAQLGKESSQFENLAEATSTASASCATTTSSSTCSSTTRTSSSSRSSAASSTPPRRCTRRPPHSPRAPAALRPPLPAQVGHDLDALRRQVRSRPACRCR